MNYYKLKFSYNDGGKTANIDVIAAADSVVEAEMNASAFLQELYSDIDCKSCQLQKQLLYSSVTEEHDSLYWLVTQKEELADGSTIIEQEIVEADDIGAAIASCSFNSFHITKTERTNIKAVIRP